MAKEQDEILKDLYKGEKSAVETYDRALKNIGSGPGVDELQKMQREHDEALAAISQHLPQDDIPESSGVWGSWANAVTETASLFGKKAALKALKEGEEHGLKQYTDALDDQIDPKVKSMIRDTFIPRQRQHIETLDDLMQQAS
jgi:hypothetical protein